LFFINMDKETISFRQSSGISVAEIIEIANIGSMFLRQGNIDKAQVVFEGLVELDSDIFEIQSCLGSFYTTIREDEKALYHLNKAISLDSENISPYVNRAEINIRRFKIDEVIADITQAIQLDPKITNPDANRARTMLLGIYDAFNTKGWIKKQMS
jgi:tetratricopeptide (TPR) repeat protein